MKKGIIINEEVIVTPIVVSTICGHWGTGLMPLALQPGYLSFLKLVRKTRTTELVKSSTFSNRWGNFIWWNPYTWKYVQRIGKDSILNAYAHTNLGLNFNLEMITLARNLDFNAVPNFAPDFSKPKEITIKEVLQAVKIVLSKGIKVIEIVPSCPNRGYCVADNPAVVTNCIRAVKKKYPQAVIIIKKGLEHSIEAVQGWEAAGMDILHGINAVLYETVFPGKISPLKKVGGGAISGTAITNIAFKDNCKTRKAISVPMIFGGGIMTRDWAFRCFDYGADAISICTVVRCNVKEAKRIVKTFNL